MKTPDPIPEDLRDFSDAPTWRVVASDLGKILAVFHGAGSRRRRNFARRTNAQAGQSCTRLHTVTDWVSPRVGDSITEELP